MELPAFDATEPVVASAPVDQAQGLPSFDDTEPTSAEQYSGVGNTLGAAAQGVARGVAGPLAPLIEKHILHIPYTQQLGMEEAHPIAHGVGEGLGLISGVGEGALMSKFGEAAAGLTKAGKAEDLVRGGNFVMGTAENLANVAKDNTLISRVGSSAAAQAAEMAVLQSGNETAKMIMQDPDTSSQSAIANIGLAAALGGAGGAFITGAVSPLWKATVGDKLSKFLESGKDMLNGGNLHPPEAVMSAFKDLNMEPSEVMKAALSGDPKMQQVAQDLYLAKNPTFMKHLEDIPEAISKSVSESLGSPLEDLAHYSKIDAGNEARESFLNEMQEKYGPIAERLEKRDELAKTIQVPDEEARNFGNRIMEKAIGKDGVGTNSPYYKIYSDYAQRVMGEENLGGLDRIKTELNRINSQDFNARAAHQDIKQMIADFQENQINKQASKLEQQGMEHGSALGKDIIKERAGVNKQYADYRKMLQELSDHTGLGEFRGTGTLKAKLSEKLSPEQFLSKFSPKGNAEAIPFLQKNFPGTAAKIQEMESKNFLAPHVKSDTGKLTVNYKTLNNAVEKGMKGSPEYMNYVLPNGFLQKIQAGKIVNDSLAGINGIKDSGTAGNLGKVFGHLGAGAVGAMGWVMGHNPISSLLVGELSQKLGKDAPEAMKLALLKFMGSDKPIDAQGFKSAVDMIHNTIKGENSLTAATKNVFKSGAQVLTSYQMPNKADRDKLDKIVSTAQDKPDMAMNKVSNGKTGHYFPDHQSALTQNVVTQTTYLAGLKSQPFKPSPLDKEIPPSSEKIARYNRALDIANSPNIVLHHLKDGTMQTTDLQDLKQLYPAVYARMAQKLSNEMTSKHADADHIPYTTRMGLSLFLGQPVDSSMNPASIQAAQPQPKPMPEQGPVKGSGKSMKALDKIPNSYKTKSQEAESDRNKR